MNQDEGLNCNPVQHLEFYNINLNAWCKVNGFDMPSPRSFFAGEILDECKLHLFGGFNGEEFSLKCQKFDLMSGEWSDLPQMAKERVDRCYASATEMDGEIYVSGGHHKRAQNKARSVEKFNPVVNAWSQVPNLTSARCEAALVNLNGCLYVIGGFDGVAVLSSVEKLEPDSRWTFSARMIRQRSGLGAVALPGCILVFGGHDGFQRLADGEKFNPDSETWTLLAPMVQARSNFGIASIGRLVFAVGGYGGPEPGQPLAEVEAYDPSIDKWFPVEKMLSPRSGLIACVADNLQLALKVWGTEERKGCVLLTSSLEKDSHQQEHAGGLSTPMLDPLPNGWLQNNTNENA
ncbi:influenza virus NS1A-binding protein-like [Neocloeon triangulifer]|uniref:influenza virus NS1A-binding protein-like n=1 Tax=Neocloeon triangulifer TaxID=2078957 RepID=UPI00286F1085|nr:influenza virus NS1A-binding protein-like [Neocloeon triangulifer]